jgi:hypothetical protein
MDVFIDAVTGKITSRAKDGNVTQTHLDLPSDVSNGLPPNLLLNFLPSTPETRLSFVAPTTKPRVISVSVKPVGEVSFQIGSTARHAVDYRLHVELGGLAGLIAPIIGKQPPITTSGFSMAPLLRLFALGLEVCLRIRQALEPLRKILWSVVASG